MVATALGLEDDGGVASAGQLGRHSELGPSQQAAPSVGTPHPGIALQFAVTFQRAVVQVPRVFFAADKLLKNLPWALR